MRRKIFVFIAAGMAVSATVYAKPLTASNFIRPGWWAVTVNNGAFTDHYSWCATKANWKNAMEKKAPNQDCHMTSWHHAGDAIRGRSVCVTHIPGGQTMKSTISFRYTGEDHGKTVVGEDTVNTVGPFGAVTSHVAMSEHWLGAVCHGK